MTDACHVGNLSQIQLEEEMKCQSLILSLKCNFTNFVMKQRYYVQSLIGT